MTNIELQFLESGLRFFREHVNHKVDWERRRFEAATLILAGMCANDQNKYPTRYECEDAVSLAEELILVLTDKNRTSKCTELYQR